jgi:Mrp family chromosome partitioning ATPase
VSRQVDGVVLVLAAEDTRWPVAERVKESIERSGGRVLGIVLNKRRYHIPPCIYRRL